MSKRFGRNQRRKLRAEMEVIKTELSRAHERARQDHLRDEALELTAQVLGRNFPTLPTQTMRIRGEMLPRIPVYRDPMRTTRDNAMYVMEALDLIQLEPIKAQSVIDRLRSQMMLYVEYPGGEVALGLSRGAFTHWPVEQAAHQVAQHLTHSLMRQQDFREFVGL